MQSQTNQEVRSLQALLETTEELLFSIPLPEQIVEKYEKLRQHHLYQAGLQNEAGNTLKIRTMQQQASISRRKKYRSEITQTDQDGLTLEQLQSKEKQGYISMMHYEYLSRIDKSYEIISQYKILLHQVLQKYFAVTSKLSQILHLNQNEVIALDLESLKQPSVYQHQNIEILIQENFIQQQKENLSQMKSSFQDKSSSSLYDLQSQHDQVIQRYKQMEKNVEEYLVKYESKFSEVDGVLQEQLYKASDLILDQDQSISQLENEIKINKEKVLQSQKSFASEAESYQAKLQNIEKSKYDTIEKIKKEQSEEVKCLKQMHGEEVKRIEKELENTRRQINENLKKYEEEFSSLQAKFKNEIEQIKERKQNEMAQLDNNYKKEIEILKQSHIEETDILKTEIQSLKESKEKETNYAKKHQDNEVERLKRQNQQAIELIKQQYEDEIQKLKLQIQNLREAHGEEVSHIKKQ